MRTYIPHGYEISKNRYMELRALCLQYDELAMTLFSTPEQQAKAWPKVRRIEDAAMQAADGCDPLYKCLLESVTRGKAYQHLKAPCGRATFYTMRKRFFYLLDLNEYETEKEK